MSLLETNTSKVIQVTTTNQATSIPRLIRAEAFRQSIGGIRRTTHHRKVISGELPAPIKIGGCDFYEESIVAELLAKKREEADARQAELIAVNKAQN